MVPGPFFPALAAWALKGNPYLGLVIGLAMLVNLTAAGLFAFLTFAVAFQQYLR